MNTYFINVVYGYQIIGDGITKLYNEKKDKIEIKLRLTEGQYGEIYEEEIIGEKKVLFNIPKADFMLKNTGNIIIAKSITNTVIGFFSLDEKNKVNHTIQNNTVYEITILYKSDWKNVSA